MSTPERRRFLKQAGLGTAALALGAGSSRAGDARKLVVGVIGTGGMGTHHVRQLARTRDVDIAYVRLGDRLLELASRGEAFPIFGTHDLTIVDTLTERARALKLPDRAWEVHMLYGIRAAEQRRLAAAGRTVKTLISYGRSWFPWYMRRLAERPANVWFVLKSALS